MRNIEKRRSRAGKRSFFRRLTFLYRLHVVNEDEQRETLSASLSHLHLVIFFIVLVALAAVLSIWFYKNTPEQRGETEMHHKVRRQLMEEALKIDSLEQVLALQEKYMENVRRVILGEVNVDTVYSMDSLMHSESVELLRPSDRERAFLAQYELNMQDSLPVYTVMFPEVERLNMLPPFSGAITDSFSVERGNLGLSMTASREEEVSSVLDGTVLLCAGSSEVGYTIVIQHADNLISVYGNCVSVTVKAGSEVKQGYAVAMASELHFELWYKGVPLESNQYIFF